jgi:uncharacterized membrane protein
MMKKYAWILVLAVIAIPFGYAIYLYPQLPDTIPTHFNARGEPDAFGSRNSIYLGPTIMGAASMLVYLLLSNIRKLDPKRAPIANNDLYWQFGLLMTSFLSCLSLVILYITAHPGSSFAKLLLPVMGLLFAAIGAFLPRFQQNYFAGLRLPWTLDNEANWNATHKMAGKWWITGGLAMALAGLVLEQAVAFVVFISILLVIILIPVLFSYRMFKKGNLVERD